MNDNVTKFFEQYNADAALRERAANAVAAYPGSLEIREAVVEAALLPIAKEMGLEFTVEELRAYENNNKIKRSQLSDEEYFGTVDDDVSYWLLDAGWSNDEAKFCGDK